MANNITINLCGTDIICACANVMNACIPTFIHTFINGANQSAFAYVDYSAVHAATDSAYNIRINELRNWSFDFDLLPAATK